MRSLILVILSVNILLGKPIFKSAIIEKDKKINGVLKKRKNNSNIKNNNFYYKQVNIKKSGFGEIENYFKKNNNGFNIYQNIENND
jgi:hypothetical protein